MSFFRQWLDRQKEFLDFAKTLIECSILLALLQIAATKFHSGLIWVLWLLLYLALFGYLTAYFRFLGMLFAERMGDRGSPRRTLLRMVGLAALLFNMALPWLITPILEQMINAGLGS
ncbi:hypothetical protein EN780_03085 [Mesorhizobium sp. M4B.F.Ca.ET.089.01.1.1]|uniref:hypothetical protein n=1 Tax=Mesorhizobium sp. M4B.F.Ca.ET.089.01.1.1 TaxID=2496662 RepID=UPI000FE38BDF|nr:hypothetical protein [Mesorhizobium sp. M4B.F.Ca.ET.089.01.1.1]RWX70518.1 hypothetical protein EN780_03085 [Mesorhizobium sp. M4B.F.Ca.ET.089.01.1.1]